MAGYTHFPAGFQLEDYLAGVANPSRLRSGTGSSAVLKDIICSIQAGRGILPPHRLICNMKNVQAALSLLSTKNALRPLLEKLRASNDAYLDHLKIDNVLGRLSRASMEMHQVTSMLFFCKNPIDPIPVPWMLRNAMQSYLGVGDRIIDLIGDLGTNTDNIAGCVIPGRNFNGGVYRGGILKRLHDNRQTFFTTWQPRRGDPIYEYEEYRNGQRRTGRILGYNEIPHKMTAEDTKLLESIERDVNEVTALVDKTIEDENNVKGYVSQGGSDFVSGTRPINTSVGCVHNAADATVAENCALAARLHALCADFDGVKVPGVEGTKMEGEEKDLMELFIEEEMADRLRQELAPNPRVTEREPILNYCGDVVGYRDVVVSGPEDPETSAGYSPGDPPRTTGSGTGVEPGFNAGGFSSRPGVSAGWGVAASATAGSATSGSATAAGTILAPRTPSAPAAINVAGRTTPVLFADSESAMVKSGAVRGQMVFRTDLKALFLRTREDGKDAGDFARIGGGEPKASASAEGKAGQITVTGGAPQVISIADSPAIPGKRLTLPPGSDADAEAPDGSMRHHPGSSRLQARLDGKWRNMVTGGGVSVTGARSAGTGTPVLDGISDDGTVGIRSIAGSGAVSVGASGGTIVISESVAGANLGTGAGHVFKERSGSGMLFRSIRGGSGIDVKESGDEIEISCSADALEAETVTSGAVAKTIMDSHSPPDGKAWFVEAVAVGRTSGSDFGAVKREFVARNDGGAIALAGTGANRVNFAAEGGTGNWDLLVSGGSVLDFKVRGGEGQAVNWKLSVRVVEV